MEPGRVISERRVGQAAAMATRSGPRRFDLLAGGSGTKAGIVGTHRGPGDPLAAAGGRPDENSEVEWSGLLTC